MKDHKQATAVLSRLVSSITALVGLGLSSFFMGDTMLCVFRVDQYQCRFDQPSVVNFSFAH